MKRDYQALALANSLDPKRFMKGGTKLSKVPDSFAVSATLRQGMLSLTTDWKDGRAAKAPASYNFDARSQVQAGPDCGKHRRGRRTWIYRQTEVRRPAVEAYGQRTREGVEEAGEVVDRGDGTCVDSGPVSVDMWRLRAELIRSHL